MNNIAITYDKINDCLNIEYNNDINNSQLKTMYEYIQNMIFKNNNIKSIY